MAVKAASEAKKKAAPRAKAAAKPAGKKKITKGAGMVCEVCGLSVIVEQVGDVEVAREDVLLCCGEPMKSKGAKANKTRK